MHEPAVPEAAVPEVAAHEAAVHEAVALEVVAHEVAAHEARRPIHSLLVRVNRYWSDVPNILVCEAHVYRYIGI